MEMASVTAGDGQSTCMQSCYNMIAAFLGVGILTLPYALSIAGWLGLLLFIAVAMVCCRTALLLERCMRGNESDVQSYGDMGYKAFGRSGKIVASLIGSTELYLSSISLLLLVSENLNYLFPHTVFYLGHLKLGEKKLFTVCTALVMLPTLFSTNVTKLSFISGLGTLGIFVIILAMLWVGGTSGYGFQDRAKVVSWKGISISTSLFLTCFGGHSVLPTLYNSMQNKQQFTKVLLLSFSCNSIVYLIVAVGGYLIFGGQTCPQITLNFPKQELGSKIALYTSLVIPLSRYPLLISPVADAIEDGLPKQYKKQLICIVIRFILLIITTLIACFFPYFESLMAIVGSFSVVLTSLLFPCCCYLKLRGGEKFNVKFIEILGIIVFGIMTGVTGLYFVVFDLVHGAG
nr:amino acid transporter AVT1I-like [Coffea arabica]